MHMFDCSIRMYLNNIIVCLATVVYQLGLCLTSTPTLTMLLTANKQSAVYQLCILTCSYRHGLQNFLY